MKIPFLSFSPMHSEIKADMQEVFDRVYNSNWYVLGKEVEHFEKAYATFNEVKHTIGLSNGLDALHLALKACGVGVGDEVIVPSNTYVATVMAVSYVGATPVFVEPSLETYNIDPSRIEPAITSRTRAIMPVHLYGQACEMTAIMKLAQERDLFVIEDNAQSQGAMFDGKLTGSWGHINATSFYPGKNLGALGDAGAITTNLDELAQRVRIFRNYGSRTKYYNEVIGHNMRLDELQAGFLNVKLRSLQLWTEQRQQLAACYNEGLRGINGIVLPKVAQGATHVFHLYVIRTKRRNELQEYLGNLGIGTLIHYPIPPHLQKAYEGLGFRSGSFPSAEEIANTALSLPLWPGMSYQEVKYVCKSISNFIF